MWSEEILEQFVLLASQRLRGDWVVCGASILPLLGINARTTWDIDFFGLDNPSQNESHKLMEIAESLGVPPECISSSAGFYLKKEKNFRAHLIEMNKNKDTTIFRPDLFLFTQLKLKRLTEVDLQDCIDLAIFEKNKKTNFRKTKILSGLTAELSKTSHPERAKRIVQLMNFFKT
ncbi:MAG: hypothetical protein AB8E15_06455 [Bdellovibrionales bacterium]